MDVFGSPTLAGRDSKGVINRNHYSIANANANSNIDYSRDMSNEGSSGGGSPRHMRNDTGYGALERELNNSGQQENYNYLNNNDLDRVMISPRQGTQLNASVPEAYLL